MIERLHATLTQTMPDIRRDAPRTDARIRRTDEALRRALLELLERKPLDEITIREITAAAGISYATFFRHHATKQALLDHIAADQIAALVALTVPVLDVSDMRAAFLALCSYVDEHRTLWTALLTGGAAAVMREELLAVSRRVAVERYPDETDIPIELAVVCTAGSIIEIITWWLAQPPGAWSVRDAAHLLERLVLPSMAALGRERRAVASWSR